MGVFSFFIRILLLLGMGLAIMTAVKVDTRTYWSNKENNPALRWFLTIIAGILFCGAIMGEDLITFVVGKF